MRRLVWIALLCVTAWCGWWVFASQNLSRGVEIWFDDRRAEGWQADLSGVQINGFPFQLNATIDAPALVDPDTGVAFSTSRLILSAPAWWPGYVTLNLPQDGMMFATPRTKRTVLISSGIAKMRLKPSSALELESLTLSSGPVQVKSGEQELIGAQGIELGLMQNENQPNLYSVTANVAALRPGADQRRVLRVPEALPDTYESLVLDMKVLLTRPIDRSTLEVARPQPERVDLKLAEAEWGPMLLRTSAALDISETGLATGDISFQARNWRDMLTLLEAAGVIPASAKPQAENILTMLANGSGNPDTLDVALVARDGRLFLGFIPVAEISPLRLP